MDQVDRSFHEQESAITESIRIARISKPEIQPTGVCHNKTCLEDVKPNQLFCNSDCANEYQRYKNISCCVH
jgi:hypothetical protein